MVEKELWKSSDWIVLMFITNARDHTNTHWVLYQTTVCGFVYQATLGRLPLYQKAWNTIYGVIFAFILNYRWDLNSRRLHLVTAPHHQGEPDLKKFIEPVTHIKCGICPSLVYGNNFFKKSSRICLKGKVHTKYV